ncbi:SpoIIE family protein phosphatase [Streptomyces lydicus]
MGASDARGEEQEDDDLDPAGRGGIVVDPRVELFPQNPEDPFAVNLAATMVLDRQGMVTGWSGQAQQLTGHKVAEVIGRPAAGLLIDPLDRERVTGAVANCQQASGWFGVLPVRHRDGHRMLLGVRAYCVARIGQDCEWVVVGAPGEAVIQWETDRAVLDGLFSRFPVGFSSHDPELKILRINRALARVGGLPSPAVARGRRIADFLHPADAETVEDGLRRVLATGKPMIFTEQSGRSRHDPDQERFVSVSAFRMQDAAGKVLGVAQLVEDVTDRHRAQRRLAMLNEASARIGTTLDVAATARELVDVAVPGLADGVSVDLLEPLSPDTEDTPAVKGVMQRVAVKSLVPQTPVPAPVGAPVHVAPDSVQGRCLTDQRPVLEQPVSPTATPATGARAVMAVPLTARGHPLGLISLWRTRPEPFEDDDLILAGEFAARAALSIDNARRYTVQQHTALTLQRSLLPQQLPQPSAVEVAHRYLPAGATTGVGGDWFDVIPLSGARVALVAGDVVGHGIHAAAAMGRLRTAVHTLADLDLEPAEVLAHLDDLVDRLATGTETSGCGEQLIGATCLYAIYDPVTQRCAAARAAHPPPVVATPDGFAALADIPAGPPLGLGGLPFETAELDVPEGTLLALYTDGLIESPDHDIDTQLARLCDVLTTTGRTLQELASATIDDLLPDLPRDDVALLLARSQALPADRVATWQLPAEPASAGRARRLTEEQLDRWGLTDLAFTTVLIATELVTNSYRYATGPVMLRLIRDRTLICEVSDPSSTSPHLRRARPTDEGGRGLLLVAQLTQRWGTRYTAEGKTVWTEQPLPGNGIPPPESAGPTGPHGHFLRNVPMP